MLFYTCISQFYISFYSSYSNVNESSKALPIVYKKTPFELQPEDGFITKPKHVANIMFQLSSNYILYNKGCVELQNYIYFINCCWSVSNILPEDDP